MPGLGLSYVSRHVRREESHKLGGGPSRKHGHARVVGRRDHDAGRDHDCKRIDARRRQHERTRRALTHVTAANDRIRRARAQADDRNEDRHGKEDREQTHLELLEAHDVPRYVRNDEHSKISSGPVVSGHDSTQPEVFSCLILRRR